jgi:hypothetical protein
MRRSKESGIWRQEELKPNGLKKKECVKKDLMKRKRHDKEGNAPQKNGVYNNR